MPIPYTQPGANYNPALGALAVYGTQGKSPPTPSAYGTGTITPTLSLLVICSSGVMTAPADGAFTISGSVSFASLGMSDTDHVNASFGVSTSAGAYLHSANVTMTDVLNSEVGVYENGTVFYRISVLKGDVFNFRLLCQLATLPSAGTISATGDLLVQFSSA